MYPVFESIKIEDGVCQNLKLHKERIHQSRLELFGVNDKLSLDPILDIAKSCGSGIYKLRFSYGIDLGKIECELYQRKDIRSLKIIQCQSIDYHLKFSDRTLINSLFEKRASADDIMIEVNGLLTDASYANLAFFDGTNWFTPEKPLLQGTKRTLLIKRSILHPRKISTASLMNYQKVSLINAMLDLDEITIPIHQIIH